MSAIAYWKETKNNAEFFQWALYLCMFGSSLIFALVFWHPQWLLFATPFLAITTYMNRKVKFFVLLDLVMFIAFIFYSVHQFGGGVDQSLLLLGVFKGLRPDLSDPLSTVFMRKILFFEKREITFTLISAVFFLNIALKFPGAKFDRWQKNFSPGYIKNCWNDIRVRFFAGIMFFVIIAFLTLVIPGGRAKIYDAHDAADQKSSIAAPVIKGTAVGQVFTAGCREIRAVVVKTLDNDPADTSNLIFRISEYDPAKPGNKIIFQETVSTEELRDKTCLIKMKKIMVSPEKKYIFSFESPDATAKNCVTILRVPGRTQGDKTFAVINNIPRQFDLDFRLYGRK
jgi:membrane-associated phospholipid phosphatase